MLPDISGDFLLAVATVLDPGLPIQFIASFDFIPAAMGETIDVELQRLALDQRSTTDPRTFVGVPLLFTGIPVAPDGSFTVNIGPLDVPFETNPIVASDASAEMTVLDLMMLDPGSVCGEFDGQLVSPLVTSLSGSTIGAVRVIDTSPVALPVVFPSACP